MKLEVKNTKKDTRKLKTLINKQLDVNDIAPLNNNELRNLIYYGFSSEELRPKYWMILLNYYTTNKFASEIYYKKRREAYASLESTNDIESMNKVSAPIDADLDRMPDLVDESEYSSYKEPLRNILILYAITNSSIGYVQGMAHVLLPIYHVLASSEDINISKFAKEDSFYMFTNLMIEIGENFGDGFDETPFGIKKKISNVYQIIEAVDKELYDTMLDKGLIGSLFPLKWILLLFSGSFKLNDVIWLWDRILSDNYRFEMVDYCSAVMIMLMKDIILKEPFDKCMEMLQNVSFLDCKVVFDVADVIRRKRDENLSLSDILKKTKK